MDLYSELFESMVGWCGSVGFRHGPINTIAMMVLGLAVSLNILSVVDLLWSFGYLENPYQSEGGLHPQRYLCALLCIAFVVNTILARRKFSADLHCLRMRRHSIPLATAPMYVLGSAGVFLITLTV